MKNETFAKLTNNEVQILKFKKMEKKHAIYKITRTGILEILTENGWKNYETVDFNENPVKLFKKKEAQKNAKNFKKECRIIAVKFYAELF